MCNRHSVHNEQSSERVLDIGHSFRQFLSCNSSNAGAGYAVDFVANKTRELCADHQTWELADFVFGQQIKFVALMSRIPFAIKQVANAGQRQVFDQAWRIDQRQRMTFLTTVGVLRNVSAPPLNAQPVANGVVNLSVALSPCSTL